MLPRLFRQRRAPECGRAAAPRRSPGTGSFSHEGRRRRSRASGAAAGSGHGPAVPLPRSGAVGAARPPPRSLRGAAGRSSPPGSCMSRAAVADAPRGRCPSDGAGPARPGPGLFVPLPGCGSPRRRRPCTSLAAPGASLRRSPAGGRALPVRRGEAGRGGRRAPQPPARPGAATGGGEDGGALDGGAGAGTRPRPRDGELSCIGGSKPPARTAFVRGAGFGFLRPPPSPFPSGGRGLQRHPPPTRAGRNGALCSPVKAPAVPELREEVSITQTKSLFFALLSPAPAASFLAPKAYWK